MTLFRSLILTLLLIVTFPLNSIAEVVFYDTNHIDSPVAMWDKNGKKVWEGEYYPFGEEYRVSKTPQKNKKRFIGKEKDEETGLTYLVLGTWMRKQDGLLLQILFELLMLFPVNSIVRSYLSHNG